MLRMKPVRSSRRIAQTANWQVNDEMTRITVRTNANHGSAWRLKCSAMAGSWVGGGHVAAVARTLK